MWNYDDDDDDEEENDEGVEDILCPVVQLFKYLDHIYLII